MFEVYDTVTGHIVAKVRDVIKANQKAIDYTVVYSWIDNHKYDWRPVSDTSHRSIRQQTSSVH